MRNAPARVHRKVVRQFALDRQLRNGRVDQLDEDVEPALCTIQQHQVGTAELALLLMPVAIDSKAPRHVLVVVHQVREKNPVGVALRRVVTHRVEERLERQAEKITNVNFSVNSNLPQSNSLFVLVGDQTRGTLWPIADIGLTHSKCQLIAATLVHSVPLGLVDLHQSLTALGLAADDEVVHRHVLGQRLQPRALVNHVPVLVTARLAGGQRQVHTHGATLTIAETLRVNGQLPAIAVQIFGRVALERCGRRLDLAAVLEELFVREDVGGVFAESSLRNPVIITVGYPNEHVFTKLTHPCVNLGTVLTGATLSISASTARRWRTISRGFPHGNSPAIVVNAF